MVDIIIGPRDNNNCCICCGECYCNCCACPAGSCMQFSTVRCEVTSAATDSVCCEGLEFTMTKRPDECWAHSNGGQCSPNYCLMDRKGDSTVWPDMWGYSGTVCTSCTTDSPPMEQSNCEGACITASLCCCRTGNPDGTCAVSATCSQPTLPAIAETPECAMDCFYFEMRGYNCYATGCGPGTDMSCSCCARRNKPDCGDCTFTWSEDDLTWGEDADNCNTTTCPATECQEPPRGGEYDGEVVTTGCTDDIYAVHYGSFDGGCGKPISGQCKVAAASPPKLFMLMVEGDYILDCDCQTGEYDPSTGATTPTTVHFTGLITEC